MINHKWKQQNNAYEIGEKVTFPSNASWKQEITNLSGLENGIHFKMTLESCFCNFAINPQGKKNPINICRWGKWTFFFFFDGQIWDWRLRKCIKPLVTIAFISLINWLWYTVEWHPSNRVKFFNQEQEYWKRRCDPLFVQVLSMAMWSTQGQWGGSPLD